MSSFWREFLAIVGLLSRYIISPVLLFICGFAIPSVKLTPKLTTLFPRIVVIPAKVVSTDAENPPSVVIDSADDSKLTYFDSEVTPI